MQKVLTAAQMREVDRLTTERFGIPSIILMENAAHAVARVITEKLGGSVKGKSILILCGKGNNGGDGAALARKLLDLGAEVDVLLFGKIAASKGDARVNLETITRLNGNQFPEMLSEVETSDALKESMSSFYKRLNGPDVIVDAIFGTGLTRPLPELHECAVSEAYDYAIRRPDTLSISVDIPTGLSADENDPLSEPFQADCTVTFTAPKPANVLTPASSFGGELIVARIGSPPELIDESPSQLFLAESQDAINWLGRTSFVDSSYKNKRGHALLIAGSENYSGAAVLAGNAAMRSGIGLVTLAAPKVSKAEIASRLLPDVILKTLETDKANELTEGANAIAVGCGLDANNPEIEKIVRDIVENRTVPVIVDAGALWFFNSPNGLLQKPDREGGRNQDVVSYALADARASASEPALILTPHEGEFLRLLGTDDKDAIKDRVAAVREFSQKHNVILVLKGERVLIGEPGGKVVVNPTGNSGLGKAGNGDTLTGILVGFVAQAAKMHIDLFDTVVAAIYVAGMAGDIAEKKYGKRVMTASDVRECLAEAFEQIGN
jgi:hydroxyethylthiazole kinase-like uncharacterized protein yjeF